MVIWPWTVIPVICLESRRAFPDLIPNLYPTDDLGRGVGTAFFRKKENEVSIGYYFGVGTPFFAK